MIMKVLRPNVTENKLQKSSASKIVMTVYSSLPLNVIEAEEEPGFRKCRPGLSCLGGETVVEAPEEDTDEEMEEESDVEDEEEEQRKDLGTGHRVSIAAMQHPGKFGGEIPWDGTGSAELERIQAEAERQRKFVMQDSGRGILQLFRYFNLTTPKRIDYLSRWPAIFRE